MFDQALARMRGRSIDDRLLAGQGTDGNAVTLARRALLVDRRYRSALARALRRLIDAARRHDRNPFVAQIPLREHEVLDSAPLILTLADELEEDERVSARGVILADRLIRDGDSPVFWPCDESVEVAVKHARAALHLG
jgi:hypothetical protein